MINPQSQSLRQEMQQLLAQVEKPSRYIGSELFATAPDGALAAEQLDVALIYPDVYEIGASNQALVILYEEARRLEGVGVERAYVPWLDMAAALRQNDLLLCSLESQRPLKDFDLLGITLPHELVATNICELLDLSGIALLAAERTENDPLILGGGPVAYNPAPFAAFFDAFLIGEGEEAFAQALLLLKEAKAKGLSRHEQLQSLADLKGYYVPAAEQPQVERRVLADFSEYPVVTQPVVPFAETSQDRLSIEILRGCTRGCRFCSAGMLNRPVRERSVDTVVAAATQGLAKTGLDEVSLSSLSSTDHSQISQILRRLTQRYADTDIKVSLPSQRLDAFGVSMATLVCATQKKGLLTFAPEAGTQRLRDVINKNVTEGEVLGALRASHEAGWRRTKLYFMLGLPTETDEDVKAIVALANKAYNTAKDAVPSEDRAKVRMSISVALFVPKAHTPFEFCGQIPREELQRRVALLKSATLHKGIDLHWHDPASSMIEAVFSRGDAALAQLGIKAWELGARFDAWSEQFDLSIWQQAASELHMDLQELASCSFNTEDPLPWDFIKGCPSRKFLVEEYRRALGADSEGTHSDGEGTHLKECPQDADDTYTSGTLLQVRPPQTTGDCSRGTCNACGVCGKGIKTVVAVPRG